MKVILTPDGMYIRHWGRWFWTYKSHPKHWIRIKG